MSMTRTQFRTYEGFADRADSLKDRLKDEGKWPGVRPQPPETDEPTQPQQVSA
jgi:hypothetical protein